MRIYDINDETVTHVVCRDGSTYWVEERDRDAAPQIDATSNVVAAFDDEASALAFSDAANFADFVDQP
jgi:uncharacterized protein (DUF1330 family)